MKTNAKHTPGPWEMNILEGLNNMLDHSKPKGLPILANGKIVCVIPSPADAGIDGFAQDANARLIASAPALAEALARTLAALEIAHEYASKTAPALACVKWAETEDAARAAIAQAEGGAQ